MPRTTFTIEVTLEVSASCKGCPALNTEPALWICRDGHERDPYGFYRPESCRARDDIQVINKPTESEVKPCTHKSPCGRAPFWHERVV